MKRVQLLALLLASVMLFLSGCGGGASGGSSDGQTLDVLVSSSHQQFAPLWKSLPQFEKETGIKVNLTQVPTSDIRTKVLQDLRLGGKNYDVVELPDDTLSAAAPYMEPLEPYLEKEGININEWKSKQVDWAVEAATWDGKLVYYPFYSGAVAAVYRKDLFEDPKERKAFKEKYGYELPTPPKTRKEFLDVAEFFTRPPDMYGVIFPGSQETGQNMMEHLIFQSGLPYLDKNNNCLWGPKYKENQDKVANEARFLQDLIYKYKVTPERATGMSANESAAFYASGKAAMQMGLVYLSWNELNSDTVVNAIGKSQSFTIPSDGKNHGGIPFYWVRGIVKNSDNKEAAWKFMKWVMDPENLKLALDKGQGVFVPTNVEVAKWAVENGRLPEATVQAVKTAQLYPINTSIAQVRETLRDRFEELMLNQITPEEFAQRTGTEIQKLMVEKGLAK